MPGLELIADGFSSSVYRTADGACLVVPKTKEAASRLRHGSMASSAIAPCVDVVVPHMVRCLPPTQQLPYGGLIRSWIDGERLDAAADPKRVAAFLGQLHGTDVSVLDGIAVPYSQWCSEQLERAQRGLAAAGALIGVELARWLEGALSDLVADLQAVSSPTVVHGDFWHENLLVEGSQLSAVLDWEFAAIGDPVIDLAGLWYLGDAWAEAVLELLRLPDSARRRCRGWRLVRELHGAEWSARHNDRNELHESAGKLVLTAQRVRAAC